MRVLIIGGTRFVGRHVAREALDRGHDVTLFNRGQTAPGLFPQAHEVHGDRRRGGFAQLSGEAFDLAVDTNAYHPDDIAPLAGLAGRIGLYCLVSSLSVLRDPLSPGADEDAAVWRPDGPLPPEFSTPEEYGLLKAECERAAGELFGGGTLVVRPGIVVGPYDYTDRLTWWLRQLSGEDVVLAGDPDQPVQLIDARDLAAWTVRAATAGTSGVFNVTGPAEGISFGDLLAAAGDVCQSQARIEWLGDDGLRARDLAPPLWLPQAEDAFFRISNARALAAGLALRPLEHTLGDTLAAMPGTG